MLSLGEDADYLGGQLVAQNKEILDPWSGELGERE